MDTPHTSPVSPVTTDSAPSKPPAPLPRADEPSPWRRRAALVLVAIVVIAALGFGYSLFTHKGTLVLGPEVLGTPGTLRIIGTTYPTDDVIVAKYVVTQTPYNADATGASDATQAFQQAMNDAAKDGGGTVFVPTGTYHFDGKLDVPTGVTLRGDWKEPTANDKTVGGAVLAVYGDGDFMTMESGSSANGLTFWYPTQSLTSPVKGTAVTIETAGKTKGGDPLRTNSVTLRNLDFVNPWIAIDTTTGSTALDRFEGDTGGNHYIYNVYGAALNTFEVLRKTSSTSDNEENHLAARYWSESGLPNSPAYKDLATYMQQNATGAVYLDNWGTYNLTIEDFGTGISFQSANLDNQVTGQQMVGVEISGAHHGIDIESGNDFYVNDASVNANVGSDAAAIYVGTGMSESMLLLNEVTLDSTGMDIDDESPNFGVSIAGSSFHSWSGYAVKATGNDVIIEGSTFAQKADDAHKDVSLGASVANARILANSVSGEWAMDSQADSSHVLVNNSALPYSSLGLTKFPTSGFSTQLTVPAQPKPARTGPDSLYVVTDYGAKSDCTASSFSTKDGSYTGGCTDNTDAFQKTLDAAGQAGGGTVFIPTSSNAGGYFIAGHLAIPKGVELLGAEQDHHFRPNDSSMLLITEGDDKPFITLGANAGIRALTVWYANQNGYCYTDKGKAIVAAAGGTCPPPFAYTIQAQGSGDWAVNSNLPNDTYGLDFGTYGSDHHYISNISSDGYITALYISKSTDGFVIDEGESAGGGNSGGPIDFPTGESASFANPLGDFYSESGDAKPDNINDGHVGQVADNYSYGAGVLVGSAKNETILNSYIHGPHTGLKTIADNGSGPSLTVIHFGSETFQGMDIEALDPKGLKVVQSEYHTLAQDGYPQGGGGPIAGSPYFTVSSSVPATTPITFFNYSNHAYTPIGFDINGGDTIIDQYTSDLQDGGGKLPVKAAVSVTGTQTGFALLGAKFIDAFSGSFVTNADNSPNVVVAGLILPANNPSTGAVDMTIAGPTTTAAKAVSTKDKSAKKPK